MFSMHAKWPAVCHKGNTFFCKFELKMHCVINDSYIVCTVEVTFGKDIQIVLLNSTKCHHLRKIFSVRTVDHACICIAFSGVTIQRQRVRDAMERNDPAGVALRALQPQLQRRQYKVAGPNSLWHIDGNHKLIR